jgi:pimeloyl-ACP methyl ester carboxylesterase
MVSDGETLTLSDGARIWYRRTGRGPVLLHVHGSAFGHRNFERLTPLLTDHFQVVDFDLPGYGESTGGPGRQSLEGFGHQAAELIEHLGDGPVHVHGTSFGAMIALHLATTHPERVDRLVLSCFLARYDSAARMMRATWKRAARETTMDAVADLTSVAGFARGFYDRPEAEAQLESMRDAFRRTRPDAFIAATEAIERADLSPLVDRLASPVLMLAGAEDNMTPFRPADSGVGMAQIARRLTGARTEVLPECGHYLVIEAASQAAELITEFLLA